MKMVTRCMTVSAVLFSGSAFASTVVIDNFDGASRVGAVGIPGFIEEDLQFGGPGIVGGFRVVFATTTGGFISTDVQIDQSRPSAVSFSNNAGESGTFTFVWDGDDSPTTVDQTGLGGVDMTGGGINTRFAFEVLSSDIAGTPFELTVWDLNGNSATVDSDDVAVVTFGNTPQTLTFDFSDFAGVDITNVGAVELFYQATEAQDMSFDSLRADTVAPVPLPAG